jgi:hypothetical protein
MIYDGCQLCRYGFLLRIVSASPRSRKISCDCHRSGFIINDSYPVTMVSVLGWLIPLLVDCLTNTPSKGR